jgi:dipeptidyl-peptidase-4
MPRINFALLCLACTCAAERKPVTIDAVVERRRPADTASTQRVWSPEGKRFVYREAGKLLMYDAISRSARELLNVETSEKAATKFAEPAEHPWENRRATERPIQWSASGQELLLLAGGDIFLWHSSSGKTDQLTNTAERERDPKLSPDGSHVAFRRDHDLYVMDIASHVVTRLTANGSPTLLNGELDWVYPEELDLGTAYWWSPDSRSIAYLQFDVSREMLYPHVDLSGLRPQLEPQRYPQAGTPNADVRLGIISIATRQTRWMDLGDTRTTLLPRVTWVPDGKQVAVLRTNRVQNRLDLILADAVTGATRTMVTETDAYWINVVDEPRFLGTANRFVWSSERDGRRHVYLYSDGQSKQITKGPFDVVSIAGVDEKNGFVYYTSTEATPLERHLYSVRFDGSARKKITTAPGTHTVTMSPSCEYFVDAFSNLTTPPRRTVNSIAGPEIAVLRESDRGPLEQYTLQPVEIREVKAADGTKLYARLIRPPNFVVSKKYPVVVDIYGGPHAQSVRNVWAGVDFDQVLAQHGFVVWQLDNRGGGGRGHAFETPLYRRLGKIELEDQLAGIKQLVALGFADPQRIGITGWSYGGFMTLYSMLNAPDVFKVGIAGAPVTDFRFYDTIYTERYLGLPDENEVGYWESSPVKYASNLKGRLLLIHNIEDDNVLFQNTLHMIDALEKANRQFLQVIYPFKTHGLTGAARRHMYETMLSFFEKNL